MAIGTDAAFLDTLSERSVYVGAEAGFGGFTSFSAKVKRSGNVFLGYQAGKFETGSDKLYIENSSADSLDALIFGDFNNDYLRFNGKIGLSTTPEAGLDVKQSGITEDAIAVKGGSDGIQITSPSQHGVHVVGAGEYGIKATGTTGSALLENDVHIIGKLGIGIDNPQKILDVTDSLPDGSSQIRHHNNAAASTGNSVALFHLLNTTTATRSALQVSSKFNDINDGSRNSEIKFQVQDNGSFSTVLGFDGSNVAIGGNFTPSATLHTVGSVRFAGFGAGTLMTDADGNLSVSSDIRLKNIIDDYQRGLPAINALNPITYSWLPESGLETAGEYTGFSAQDVMEVIPEAVNRDKNGFLTLSDRPIIATMVNAIQDLSEENQSLHEEIDLLKKEMAELREWIRHRPKGDLDN